MCLFTRVQAAVHHCARSSHLRILIFAGLLVQAVFVQQTLAATATAGDGASRGLPRTRTAKIASVHGLQAAAESIPARQDKKSSADDVAGKYEIRSVSGEPNYKSVNLTWEVEFVPSESADSMADGSKHIDAITNSSAEVEPPKVFQIFFCELQSFGPHRCRSKLVNDSQQVMPYHHTAREHGKKQLELQPEQQQHHSRRYSTEIRNLRMATKYSFHVRPQLKRRNMKITGRSEIFGNEVYEEQNGSQMIIIPTKGFAAQATRCLPHASEIEVETGPYFGGRIVVDGGDCGIKGRADDSVDRYTMRIDHKMCGSLVKPETNTVETFITVQENLGIFTHSTRSFQSGMQTVRASFTVPGKDGVAAAVENDPFEPDERIGREQRQMRYVDRSGLVLKDTVGDEVTEQAPTAYLPHSEESVAIVEEVPAPPPNVTASTSTEVVDNDQDIDNTVAILEDIIPGLNEDDIKHEHEHERNESAEDNLLPVEHARYAKTAKLMGQRSEEEEEESNGVLSKKEWYDIKGQERAYDSSLHYISLNMGGVIMTLALTVIILGVLVFLVHREARRRRNMQMRSSNTNAPPLPQRKQHLPHKPIPRALQSKLEASNSM